MPFDFKKEYREFYMPSCKPELVDLPAANYLAVQGKGDPNEENGAYQQAIAVLYSVAYTLKMSARAGYEMEGFFDYVVPPLEGLWWSEDGAPLDSADKRDYCWISLIRLPDFVTRQDVAWAVETAQRKKELDCSALEFLPLEEGLCVQAMHIGSFDEEGATVAAMEEYLTKQGYVSDLSPQRRHHEIYLSDARRVAPEKRKTVLRYPVRKAEGTV